MQRRKTAAIEVDGAETATVVEEEKTVWECRRRKRAQYRRREQKQ